MRAALLLAAAGSVMASASLAAEYRITMSGMTYAPAAGEAKVGDTLIFINDDVVAHDVFVPTVGFSTDFGKQDPGKEARLLLRKSGLFDVECVFHENMHTRIVVRP